MRYEFHTNKCNVTQNAGKGMVILFRIQNRTVRYRRAGYSEQKIGYLTHKAGILKQLQIFAWVMCAVEQVEKLS